MSAEEANTLLARGRNLVVTIGINDYVHWPLLHRAVSDAVCVQKLLVEKFGFLAPYPPLLNGDATAKAIRTLLLDTLRTFLLPDDSLVLFFAGHGHTLVERVGDAEVESGFLIPVEAQRDHLSDYLDAEALLKDVGKLPARHVLLILDACRSGIALGDAMQIHRSAIRYEDDLSGRVSRKVITSARRDQSAQDGGPVPGHSLFTGTLVQGLNWGMADLDGNNLVTSSELGLYLQQLVGQASGSQQTPDFGSFHLDGRGELVISLRDDNFEAVKARAFGAMLRYDERGLNALVRQLTALRPESPETLYLQYRLSLMHADINAAAEAVSRLCAADFPEGDLPLSSGDVAALSFQLRFWQPVLRVPQGRPPIDVSMLKGQASAELSLSSSEPFSRGDTRLGEAYEIEDGSLIQIEVANCGELPAHLYSITFVPDGRLLVQPLLASDDSRFNGLPAGATERGPSFVMRGLPGSVTEMRIIYSPHRISAMLFPTTTATRDGEGLDSAQMTGIQVLTIFIQTPGNRGSEIESPVDQPSANDALSKTKKTRQNQPFILSAEAIKQRYGGWRTCMFAVKHKSMTKNTPRDLRLRTGSDRRVIVSGPRKGGRA